MKIRILGCSGGIGGPHLRTTSMLVDQDILVDAGTGVADLSLEELVAIDHVFLTHAHLDHIAALPLLIDTVLDQRRDRPVTVHAAGETLEVLHRHIFNWSVWPDFRAIPSRESPCLQFHAISEGQAVDLGRGRRITALPAAHTVPAVGYLLDSGAASLAFSGDTCSNPRLWPLLNGAEKLRYLLIETAFPNRERQLAMDSKHLCPELLAAELAQLQRPADIFITHLKPGQAEQIMAEIADCVSGFRPRMLQHQQVFEL